MKISKELIKIAKLIQGNSRHSVKLKNAQKELLDKFEGVSKNIQISLRQLDKPIDKTNIDEVSKDLVNLGTNLTDLSTNAEQFNRLVNIIGDDIVNEIYD